MDVFEQARTGFDRHVSGFRSSDGTAPFAIEAKYQHTGEVCAITEQITAGENRFSPHDILMFRLCALFHDLSRFEQYAKYHTFLDAVSFDHGNRSAELIDELQFIPELPQEDRALIIDAVRVHNKYAIPEDFPAAHLAAAKMVRDADKLAILHLLLLFFGGEIDDPTVRLDLPDTPGWNPAVLAAAQSGHCVHYTDMKNINDFKLGIFAWAGDLNYSASAGIALKEDLFGRLRGLLPDGAEIDALLEYARSLLLARKNGQQKTNPS